MLIIYEFDILFYYVLSKWENLTHDVKVLQNVINNQEFTISEGKYYLANVEYFNYDFLLISYMKIRYYLKKQIDIEKKLENVKKLFNLRHS